MPSKKYSMLMLVSACLLFCSQAMANQVACGSKGNTLKLDVSNSGSLGKLEAVSVSVVDSPDWVVNFGPDPCPIGGIEVGETRTASFTFDVKEGARISDSGGLVLKVSAAGGEWEWITKVPLEVGEDAPKMQWAATTTCCEPPAAIELVSLDAVGYEDRIVIKWVTETEINNAGFNMYRGESVDGAMGVINEGLIASNGNAVQGGSYSYVDDDVAEGITYYYWLEDIDIHGGSTVHGPVSGRVGSGVEGGQEATLTLFSLSESYPNPFVRATEIKYGLQVGCHVRLEVYNAAGQRIATLVDRYEEAGERVAHWDGRDDRGMEISSGIYFCRLQAMGLEKVRKMIILR